MQFWSLHLNVSPRISLLIIVAFLTACGTNPYSLPKVESPQPDYDESAEPVPPPAVPAPPPESATSANNVLLARAEEARTAGDYERALAYLERAQRIDPDDAGVYLALAETHAAAGNAAQARAVAERGLLYCQGQVQCDALRRLAR